MRMFLARVCMSALLFISLKGFSQQLIQATLKLNSNPDEVEVWIRPNFSNTTQYLAQIGVPIAWPASAPIQPSLTTANITLGSSFTATFGSNYNITLFPIAQNLSGTERYRVIFLERTGGGASVPQNWNSGTEYKLLTVKFVPTGSPGAKVKIADYQTDGGGSDGQGFFYTGDGNANYYISATSANNFYLTSGQSTVGTSGGNNGYVETNVSIPVACPIPSISINGITTTGADVSWATISGASGYEYAITTTSTPPSSGTATNSTTFSPSGLNAATQYYVHVRTNCGSGSFSNWATTDFTTASASCISPARPIVNNVQITTADISWNAVSGATAYEYVLSASSSTPASAPGTGTATTGTTYNASGLIGGTQYYIFVRTNCGSENYSPWVSATFTAQPPLCIAPSTPIISGITTTTAIITWNAVSGSSGYEYVISTSSVLPTGAGTAIAGTTINSNGLTQGTAYYIFVRNNCGGGLFSDWIPASFNTMCPTPGPITASSVTSSSATISWSTTGAVSYQIDISTSSTPTTAPPTTGGTTTSSTSYNVTGLASGITYYAHVRAICADGNLSNWLFVQFSTTCTAPGQISVDNITPTSANINWGSVPDAEGYEYIITTNSALPSGSGTGIIFSNISPSTLTEGTQYYIFVRTKCSVGVYSDWISKSFSTTYPLCNLPSSLTVTNIEATADINWLAVNGVTSYEIAITTSSIEPASGISVGETKYHVGDLVSNVQYYVYVRSICGPARFSRWVKQQFKTTCFKPSLFPINTFSQETGTADIGWFSIKGALKYEYAVLNKSIFIGGTFNFTTDTSYHTEGLYPGSKYYMHVRTHCGPTSISEWSVMEFYTTGLIIGSNPSGNIINVITNGSNAQNQYISVFDASGKLLSRIKVTGSITQINLSNYASGIYFIQFGEGKKFVKKIIKL